MELNKILHYGQIAGISHFYSEAIKQVGLESKHVIPSDKDQGGTDQNNFDRQLPYDRMLYKVTSHKVIKLAKKILFCFHAMREFNLVHYYSDSILRTFDLILYQSVGIPRIISWAGGEARIISEARKMNPYFYRQPDENHDRKIINRLEKLSEYIDFVATDPELAEYSRSFFKKVFLLPQPIDLSTCFNRPPSNSSRDPIVLHIPTHKEVKGTSFIEAAVEQLKSEGIKFKFQLINPIMSQTQVRKQIAIADIYVDDLRTGSYGMTAVEAMASAKPTITYIREDLIDQYPPGLPLVNANPDTIYTKLKMLIQDADMRQDIGIRSRGYVEEVHSLNVIGHKLKNIYLEIGLK